MNIIDIQNVSKIYRSGILNVTALADINLEVRKGEILSITGPSGSGKSTLMNIIGLLDRPTEGDLKIDNELITLSMSDKKLAKMRSEKIGFVFQTFNLLPRLTALDNVLLPTVYSKKSKKERLTRAKEILKKVGLENRMHHRPSELSGGEKQRVAIARALINNPEIILADEPTGNLDSKSGQEIIAVLKKLNHEGKTIIVITHDSKIAAQCGKNIRLFDGHLVDKEHND